MKLFISAVIASTGTFIAVLLGHNSLGLAIAVWVLMTVFWISSLTTVKRQ